MPESQTEVTRRYVSPDRFHFISWVLCMSGILIPMFVSSAIIDQQVEIPMAYFFGSFFLSLYLAIPYTIYHNQVVIGKMTGWFAQLVFLSFFGMVGILNREMTWTFSQLVSFLFTIAVVAVLILLYWDLIRWLQTLIMKPYFEVRYSVNSKGMLRG